MDQRLEKKALSAASKSSKSVSRMTARVQQIIKVSRMWTAARSDSPRRSGRLCARRAEQKRPSLRRCEECMWVRGGEECMGRRSESEDGGREGREDESGRAPARHGRPCARARERDREREASLRETSPYFSQC
eukprot:5196124-Pleurochrysis_carterae.AAC.1